MRTSLTPLAMPSSTRQGHDVRGEGLEHGRVEMPAGRCDGMTGRDDARARRSSPRSMAFFSATSSSRPAGLDEQAEVAHRREAGAQGATGVGHGPQGAHGGVVLDRGQRAAVVGAAEEQVDLHVHEAGEQRDVAEVDARRRRPAREVGATATMRSSATRRLPGVTYSPVTTSSMRALRNA